MTSSSSARLAFGLACALAAASPMAAERVGTELTAGAARADITPDLQLTNWITHKPYHEMLEPIFVRAVVLAQGTTRLACISWELLYPMEGAVREVRQRIRLATGIPDQNILVSATHNHSAPWSPILADPLTQAEQKVLESFLNDPAYPAWKEKLFAASVRAVQKADENRVPASLLIGRACAGDLIFNRRPRKPDGSVQNTMSPANAQVLPQGLRFGPLDPTLTVLTVEQTDHKPIATLYNLPCHAVGIYPSFDGISSDWPGALSASLQQELGGEALFLQGCAGDIVPARRGQEARTHMASTLKARILETRAVSLKLGADSLRAAGVKIRSPLSQAARKDMGRETLELEVQVITAGDLAIVGLPGEPFIGVAMAIQNKSPFPHTVVLGYSNGYGTQYVGMPGEKALGGYETGARNLGEDECGQLLVNAALSLLEKHRPGIKIF